MVYDRDEDGFIHYPPRVVEMGTSLSGSAKCIASGGSHSLIVIAETTKEGGSELSIWGCGNGDKGQLGTAPNWGKGFGFGSGRESETKCLAYGGTLLPGKRCFEKLAIFEVAPGTVPRPAAARPPRG